MTRSRTAPARAVVTEHYYRIKWGSADEFKRLYERSEPQTGPVLTIAVEHHHVFAGRGANAAFHRGAVPLVVRMAQHAGAG